MNSTLRECDLILLQRVGNGSTCSDPLPSQEMCGVKEKMWSGFRGVLFTFQNDRLWAECVKFTENSFEIYQVLYSHPYSCEPWMITFNRP